MRSPRDIFQPETTDDSDTSEEPPDLGFGTKVASESRVRLLNRDGSFNVERRGLPLLRSLNPYHALLNLSWASFLLVTFAVFVAVNLAFALGFVALGPGALTGGEATTGVDRVAEAFFFSVQTFTSVGYGVLSPSTTGANLLATICAFTGLVGFALVAGLVFARFAQPQPMVVFSDYALIAPYQDGSAFEFRIANQNRTHLMEVEAQVVLQWTRHEGGRRRTEFHNLSLERNSVAFLPLHWTIVHPIDADSPLHGLDPEELVHREAEFLIQLRGVDEASSEVVHTRSSYRYDEVVRGAEFTNIIERTDDGRVQIDLRRLGDFDRTDDSRDANSDGPAGEKAQSES